MSKEIRERPEIGISKLCTIAHDTAKSKGFWDDHRSVLGLLMLITTEVAEAAETVRKEGLDGNFGEELADICIRVFDLAKATGVDLDAEILAKMATNTKRPIKHGKHFEEFRLEVKNERTI